MPNFMKILPLETEIFHANKQTVRQKKHGSNNHLSTFYNLCEMYVYSINLYNIRFRIFAVGNFTRYSVLSADAV